MEFTEEFAVLQGSFMLIERSNVYCDAKSLSVDLELVSDAINDIVDGLSKPHDVSEQELWRLKIHSVMFVKWLENCHDTPLPKSDRNNQVDKKEWSKEDVNDFGNFQEKYFVNSVCVVPTIPTQFYTELLKTLGWSRYLFQCLMRVNCETAIVLIEHLFLYLSKEDSNTKFLVELLECVCNYCRSNSHVELLPTFLSQLLKAIQNRHPDMLKTNIFKILVKFLDDLTKHGVINDASSDEILQDCLARNAKQQSYSMERKKMSDDLPSFLKSQTLILEILISFLSENIFVDCEDSFTVLLSDGCQSMNPVIRSLVELFQRIETCGQFDKAVVTKIATLQTRIPCTLHPVCQSLNESAVIRDEVEILENKLTDVIWRIDERLTGYRAAMDWLLSCKELWFDTRWIQCVSNNLPSIATVRSVTMVIDILHNIDNKSSLFEHLKLVLLQCHASLPLSSQNILRDYLIDEYGLPTLYEKYSPDDFSQQLTTVFNKLVNVEENIDFMQLLSEIASLAIQSPTETIKKIVTIATSNPSQIPMCVEILQCIATVCHYQYRNHSNTVLCEAIHNISDTLEESNTKLTNLLELLTSLLKPYSLALDVNSSPLLNVLEFVRTCCLPYLGFHENQVSPLTALQLLRVTMVISKSTDHLWLKTLPIFPIMLCLCNIIGECDMMWDNGCYGDQMIEIKDLSVDLLYHFIKTLHESPTKDMKRIVRWLQSRLQSVRWTVLLYLDQFLCQQITHHKKSVPRELFSICDLPLDDWQPLDHQEQGNENCYGFLTFLQCCQVSSELGERLYQCLRRNQLTSLNFCKVTLSALVQVLPQCTSHEWDTVIHIIQRLMHDGILQVPYGTRFTHQLPYFTYQDKMVELCTCQLLTLVMEQISGSLSLWKHVTKHYSSTIKNLVSRLFASPPSSSSYCFLIGQYFCHICQVASIVQSEVLEQIFVLSLELLNTLDEFASNNHTIDSMELINQKTVMLSAVAMVPDCEKRSRLVQKMNTVFEG